METIKHLCLQDNVVRKMPFYPVEPSSESGLLTDSGVLIYSPGKIREHYRVHEG